MESGPHTAKRHACVHCEGPGAHVGVWRTDKWGNRYVGAYVHPECRKVHAERAARLRATRLAIKWEAAGQQAFPGLTEREG